MRGTNISCHTDFLKFNPFILLFFTCILRLSLDFFSPTVPTFLLKQQSSSQTCIGLNTSHLNITPFFFEAFMFHSSISGPAAVLGHCRRAKSLNSMLQFPHWKSNLDAVRASPDLSAFTYNSDTYVKPLSKNVALFFLLSNAVYFAYC